MHIHVLGPILAQCGVIAFGTESALGICGLMSTIREPSNASSPLTVNILSSIVISSATQKPIGLDRLRLLEAKNTHF